MYFKKKHATQKVPKNAHQCAFNRNNKLVYANKLIKFMIVMINNSVATATAAVQCSIA